MWNCENFEHFWTHFHSQKLWKMLFTSRETNCKNKMILSKHIFLFFILIYWRETNHEKLILLINRLWKIWFPRRIRKYCWKLIKNDCKKKHQLLCIISSSLMIHQSLKKYEKKKLSLFVIVIPYLFSAILSIKSRIWTRQFSLSSRIHKYLIFDI